MACHKHNAFTLTIDKDPQEFIKLIHVTSLRKFESQILEFIMLHFLVR